MMRSSSLFKRTVLLLAGTAMAQSNLLSQMPKCAVTCFEQTISVSSCSPSNISCLCTDTAFLAAAQACEAKSCTVKEILSSTNATLAACGAPAGNETPTLLGIATSFGSLAIILVLIRVGGRLWVTKVNLDWDDYLIMLAVITASVLNFVCVPMAKAGMGKDLWTIPFPNLYTTFKLLYIAEIFYMFSEMLVQLSLLAFYVRVFPEDALFIRRGARILMAVVVCFGTANTFTMIFQCTPVSYFWTSWAGETKGTCIDINLYSWVRAAIEIAIDVSILSLPLPKLIRLQMGWKKKFQVLLMFAMGFIITLISILRLQSLIQFSETSNPTHDNTPAVYWSVLECDMFIVCACLPAIRSIISTVVPSLLGSDNKSSYPAGVKYYRHGGDSGPDGDGSNLSNLESQSQGTSGSSHQLRRLSQPGKIVKSVDVDVYRREPTASDEELVLSPRRHAPRGV